jgi:uncharacterized protein YndB with AHSA1/START domain
VHNELSINASCEQVWQRLIEARKWPEWYPNAKNVEIGGNGVLTPDTAWQWTTFGVTYDSHIHEFVPYSRLSWFGNPPGQQDPTGYHTWYLIPSGSSCHVVTEETGFGPAAVHLRETNGTLMHRGHDLWLATLKWVAENDSVQ